MSPFPFSNSSLWLLPFIRQRSEGKDRTTSEVDIYFVRRTYCNTLERTVTEISDKDFPEDDIWGKIRGK